MQVRILLGALQAIGSMNSRSSPIQRHKQTISVRSVLFFTLLFVLLFFAFNERRYGKAISNNSVSPTSEESVIAEKKEEDMNTTPTSLSDLSLQIRTLLDKQEGTYSVRFEDFTTKEAFGINDELVMTAASVIKLPILASLYYLASEETINLEEEFTIQPGDVQDWGTGSIRYEQQPIIHTNRELSQLLMEKSDNTAAFVFTHRIIGEEKIHQLINTWGLTKTNLTENETTNKDMNLLMRMIFEGKIANEAFTQEMIGIMDDSDFEDRLPFLLPSDAVVYHKIGNEVRVVNDVGVIEYGGKRWYVGVLTDNIPDETATKHVIARISKLIFDYQTRVD